MSKVVFVGAGPGAPDLLTFRAARAIAAADVVIWASSLVHPEVLQHARADAEIVDSALLPMEGVLPYYERALAEGLTIARIHSGDPGLWGALQEQLDRCREMGLATEVIPGVSAFSAVAAAVERELTIPEVAQSVILTRLGGGKTPLNQWTVYHPKSSKSTFESKTACLAAMDALRHPPLPSEPGRGSARGVQPTTSFDHLACIPADDPRLKK